MNLTKTYTNREFTTISVLKQLTLKKNAASKVKLTELIFRILCYCNGFPKCKFDKRRCMAWRYGLAILLLTKIFPETRPLMECLNPLIFCSVSFYPIFRLFESFFLFLFIVLSVFSPVLFCLPFVFVYLLFFSTNLQD